MFFLLNILLLAFSIAAWLSQCIDTNDIGLIHNGIFDNRFMSHSASELALSRVIKSASIVDCVTQVCLDDFQETTPPPSVKNVLVSGFHLI